VNIPPFHTSGTAEHGARNFQTDTSKADTLTASSSARAASQKAWFKEMELAQIREWFRGFDGTSASPSPRTPTSVITMASAWHPARSVLPYGSHTADAAADLQVLHGDTPSEKYEAKEAPTSHSPQQGEQQSISAYPAGACSRTLTAPALSAQETPAPWTRSGIALASARRDDANFGESMPRYAAHPSPTLAVPLAAQFGPAAPLVGEAVVPEDVKDVVLHVISGLETEASASAKKATSDNAHEISSASPPLLGTALINGESATRVHAQWTPEGLQLWLGMDGTAEQIENQAVALLQELQNALRGQGQRLARMVCNGRIVWDSELESGATPTPAKVFAQVLEQQANASSLYSLSAKDPT
jgi:hypothetical protein